MSSESVKLPKLLVLLGPTTAGKTEWGLRLAKEFTGEIICADSRQVYKKMDIGTAKPKGEWKRNGLRKSFMIEDVPHHIIDFLDPGKKFSAAEYRDRALKYTKIAYKGGRIPIISGGTGLYIQSVTDNLHFPRVAPNYKLRKSFETKSIGELVQLLKNIDPAALTMIDTQNIRRVIRALEVCIMSGEPFSKQRLKGDPLFEVLQVGIEVDRMALDKRIEERINKMIDAGLVQEIRGLLNQKYSWELPSMSGIGYRQFRKYFEGQHTLQEAIDLLKRDTRHYARRQLTWFNRDKRIKWVKTYEEARELIKKFLT